MTKRICLPFLCLTLLLAFCCAFALAEEPLTLDSLMTEIEAAPKAVSMGELSFEVSGDKQSIYIDRPEVSGAANYPIAYNIYDSNSVPVNYFYSDAERVAATPGYGGLFNVFVVVTDTDTGMTVSGNIGWTELNWPYARRLTVSKAAFALSEDRKSVYVDRPEIRCKSGRVTIAYNIYDDHSRPVNYFYSTEKRVAATPGYDGKFNIFITVTDPESNETDTQNIGWQILGDYTPPDPTAEYLYTVSDGQAVITRYQGSAAEVTVPEALGGAPVTVVGDGAFTGNETLARVTLPASVKAIGDNAFSHCTGLAQIDMPGVISIGIGAFSGCASLEDIDLNDGLSEIADYAFQGTALTLVTVPGSVEVIGEGAFYGCEALKTVDFEPGLKEIRTNAFYQCRKLSYMTLPEGTETLRTNVFVSCLDFTSITIPRSVTVMEPYVFLRCQRVVIHCYIGSVAHEYAKYYGHRFVMIDQGT